MSRRIAVIALALASLALGACSAPTAPRQETVVEPCSTGAVTNGSSTKTCK